MQSQSNVDWRWHRLFMIVCHGLQNTPEAKRATARLLRAKRRTDHHIKDHSLEKEKEHGKDS